MFLNCQGGKSSYFELILRNKWRKGAKEAINGVFDEDLECVSKIANHRILDNSLNASIGSRNCGMNIDFYF